MAITRVTLETISSQLRARWESVPFWSSEEARLALNESLRSWNMFTGTWKRRIVVGVPQLEHWVSLPAPILYTTRISHAGRPLDYSSRDDLDNGRPSWESESTSSGGTVPTVPRKWAPAGLTLIAIWPSMHFQRATLAIDGVASTPQLVLDSDYVDLEDSEHSAILGEALHLAAFKEGGARWETTFRYHREFLLAASDRNARLKSSTFFRRYLGLDATRDRVKMREPLTPVLSGASA